MSSSSSQVFRVD